MPIHNDWQFTPERVAIHLQTGTAVLADLHLGYHAARRRRGEAVPVPVLADLLAPLAAVLERSSLSRIVVAGDLFEDGADDAVIPALLEWLAHKRTTLFAVVPGNHDRRLTAGIPGVAVFPEGFPLGSWLVVHGHHALPRRPTICGHWHPSLQVGKCQHPCYLLGKRSLILPAYCQEARGVPVNGSRAWRLHRCLVPVGPDVLDFGLIGMVSGKIKKPVLLHPRGKRQACTVRGQI